MKLQFNHITVVLYSCNRFKLHVVTKEPRDFDALYNKWFYTQIHNLYYITIKYYRLRF